REKIEKPDWLESIDAVGPYLNFRIDREYLFRTVIKEVLSSKGKYGFADRTSGKRFLVEFSSPNTNKPLHLGHIRNNVLGMAVINLLKAVGHTVIPASIMNDRGIHICKAMVAYRHFGNGRAPDEQLKGDHLVGEMYVKFDRESKNNPELMEEAREDLRKWEKGDPETLKLWETLNSWVYSGFDRTYVRLGSKFELVQYESNTYLLGKKIVVKGLKAGVFQKLDDGSIWIDLSDKGLDEKALLRSDGTSLYVTQDLGVAVERFKNLNLDEVVYVVGSEQIYHFKVLFEIFRRLGFVWAERCKHLSYGMVYLPEGKMKSREGKVVDADDLMNQMKDLSLGVMDESHFSVDVSKREKIAESIGLGAIKYYILKFNPQKDIHFDPEKSLSFEGTTGAYIQYCHARIASVLRRANQTISWNFEKGKLQTVEEIELIKKIMQFPVILQSAATDLNPSRLAGYLWDLAKAYNVFYTRNRILDIDDSELSQARLALSAATAEVISAGLKILGIVPVEEM
ncbi:arginine--tRNA ligase, partial [bacterium]|nr:arginine--tRNA ligase [bacterium]